MSILIIYCYNYNINAQLDNNSLSAGKCTYTGMSSLFNVTIIHSRHYCILIRRYTKINHAFMCIILIVRIFFIIFVIKMKMHHCIVNGDIIHFLSLSFLFYNTPFQITTIIDLLTVRICKELCFEHLIDHKINRDTDTK